MSSLNKNRKRPIAGDNEGDRLFAPKVTKKAKTSNIVQQAIIQSDKPPPTPSAHEDMFDVNRHSSLPQPEWYSEVPKKFKGSRGDLQHVKYLKLTHEDAKKALERGEGLTHRIGLVRSQLQFLGCASFVTKAILKQSDILTDTTFHEIFNAVAFAASPSYSLAIQSDARQLYERWFKGDLDGYLLRGIQSTLIQTRNKISFNTSLCRKYQIDEDYRRTPADFFGEGHLRNGDWWPLQLAAVRDGAHGERRGGISGRVNQGAYSVVMNMADEKDSIDLANIPDVYNRYPNFDLPDKDQIWYCGTQGKQGKAGQPRDLSSETKMLKLSFKEDKAIRVIRGSGCKSRLAPEEGYRYDGLYRIIDSACIRPEYAVWLFLLERLPNQDPIRYQGPDVRPHEVELREWNRWQQRASAYKFE